MFRISIVWGLLLSLGLTTACGQKGPLVLPSNDSETVAGSVNSSNDEEQGLETNSDTDSGVNNE